jgi:hypothetical protein
MANAPIRSDHTFSSDRLQILTGNILVCFLGGYGGSQHIDGPSTYHSPHSHCMGVGDTEVEKTGVVLHFCDPHSVRQLSVPQDV